jgi:MscS family membrane protein
LRFPYLAAALLVPLVLADAQQSVPGSIAVPVATRVATDPLGRDNPQSAVIGFLQACRTQDYTKATAYLDLHALPAGQKGAEGPTLARQLELLLDRNMEFDAGSLSRDPEGDAGAGGREIVATLVDDGKTYPLELERVQLRPGVSVWQFSASSVGFIPRLYTVVGESALERRLPEPLVSWTVLDTPLWRWLALALLAALLAALSSLLSRGLLGLARPLLRHMSAYLHTELLEALAGPLRLLVAIAGFRAGMDFLGPSALLRLYLGRALAFLLAIGIAWVAMRLADVATDRFRFVFAADHISLSSSILPLLNKVIKIVIFVLAVMVILGNLGYSTTAVLAGVGVGGLAVALAAQKTIENLFGGVAVISDRPVLVGDTCRFGDRTGTVEDIGLRSTRIRTPDRTLVTVPNAQFSSMTLENVSRRDKIWFHPRLSLTRETSPAQLRQLLASISRLLDSDPKVEPGSSSVRFTAVGAYSFDLDVSSYILTSDDDEFSRVQQEFLLRILEAVQSIGTCLALPTQATVSYNTDATGARHAEPQGKTAAAQGRGV